MKFWKLISITGFSVAALALGQAPLPCSLFGEPRCTKTPTPIRSATATATATVAATLTPIRPPTPGPGGVTPTPIVTPVPTYIMARVKGITIAGLKRDDLTEVNGVLVWKATQQPIPIRFEWEDKTVSEPYTLRRIP